MTCTRCGELGAAVVRGMCPDCLVDCQVESAVHGHAGSGRGEGMLYDLFALGIEDDDDYQQTLAVASCLSEYEELTDRWRRALWVLGELIDDYEYQHGINP